MGRINWKRNITNSELWPFNVHYVELDSNLIYNEAGPERVGTKGWSEEDIKSKKAAGLKYIAKMNRKNGFYDKLEESILKEGFRNPILIKSGWCSGITKRRRPPELKNNIKNLLVCDSLGGSRLYVAVKHNMKIPCIVADFVGRFSDQPKLNSAEAILSYFVDKPEEVIINEMGMYMKFLPHSHLEE